MAASPIKFGTSGWRGIIADDFTFANVRLAVAAIAEHVLQPEAKPDAPGGARHALFFRGIRAHRGHRARANTASKSLLCDGATPTPTVAYEIRRRKARWRHQFHRQPQSRANITA